MSDSDGTVPLRGNEWQKRERRRLAHEAGVVVLQRLRAGAPMTRQDIQDAIPADLAGQRFELLGIDRPGEVPSTAASKVGEGRRMLAAEALTWLAIEGQVVRSRDGDGEEVVRLDGEPPAGVLLSPHRASPPDAPPPGDAPAPPDPRPVVLRLASAAENGGLQGEAVALDPVVCKENGRAVGEDRAALALAPSPDLGGILAQLREQRDRLRASRCEVVRQIVVIGALLTDLKKLARGDWARKAREVGYHPREASRLQNIGASWWKGEIGTAGSDFWGALPDDSKKLEWLCRLSREQLAALRVLIPDLRDCSRARLIAAVQAILGGAVGLPERPEPDGCREANSLARLLENLFTHAERVIGEIPPADRGTESLADLEAVIDRRVPRVRGALRRAFERPTEGREDESRPASGCDPPRIAG